MRARPARAAGGKSWEPVKTRRLNHSSPSLIPTEAVHSQESERRMEPFPQAYACQRQDPLLRRLLKRFGEHSLHLVLELSPEATRVQA